GPGRGAEGDLGLERHRLAVGRGRLGRAGELHGRADRLGERGRRAGRVVHVAGVDGRDRVRPRRQTGGRERRRAAGHGVGAEEGAAVEERHQPARRDRYGRGRRQRRRERDRLAGARRGARRPQRQGVGDRRDGQVGPGGRALGERGVALVDGLHLVRPRGEQGVDGQRRLAVHHGGGAVHVPVVPEDDVPGRGAATGGGDGRRQGRLLAGRGRRPRRQGEGRDGGGPGFGVEVGQLVEAGDREAAGGRDDRRRVREDRDAVRRLDDDVVPHLADAVDVGRA